MSSDPSSDYSPILIGRGPMLNFWRAPIELTHPHIDATFFYFGNEWRFQAMKTTCMRDDLDVEYLCSVHEGIARAPQAGTAKEAGRNLVIDSLAWDKRSYDVMLEANRAKFAQHEDLAADLLETGHHELVEHRPDPIWGDNMDGSGQNLQGKQLMRVRAEMKIKALDRASVDMLEEIAEELRGPHRNVNVDLAVWLMMAEEALRKGIGVRAIAQQYVDIADGKVAA